MPSKTSLGDVVLIISVVIRWILYISLLKVIMVGNLLGGYWVDDF